MRVNKWVAKREAHGSAIDFTGNHKLKRSNDRRSSDFDTREKEERKESLLLFRVGKQRKKKRKARLKV